MLYIDCKFRVVGSKGFCCTELLANIAAEIFVCGLPLARNRFLKNQAAKFGADFIFIFAIQLCHIGKIHMSTFSHGNGQCLHGSIDRCNRLRFSDGTLAENICLADEISLIVCDLQRSQQTIGGILIEGSAVARAGDQTKVACELIVFGIQKCHLCLNLFIAGIIQLKIQQTAGNLTQLNHAADTGGSGDRQFLFVHAGIFTPVNVTIHNGVAEILYRGVSRNGNLFRLKVAVLEFISSDGSLDVLNCFMELLFQIGPFYGGNSDF